MLFVTVLAYSMTIPRENKICLGQHLITDSSMQISVFVVSGGDLKISSRLIDPTRQELKTVSMESAFTLIVNSAVQGVYEFCFWNYDSVERNISFFMIVQEPEKDKVLEPIDRSILMSQERMSQVQQFQRQQQQMDNRLVYILNGVQSSLSFNAFVKIMVIIGCGIFQIFSFKKYFSKKRTAV